MARKRAGGRPNGKNKGNKGTPRREHAGAGAGTPRNRRGHVDEAAYDFSLQDEARWASNHRSSAFSANKKLRSLKIEFVSAGLLVGTIPEKVIEKAPEDVPEDLPESVPEEVLEYRMSPSPESPAADVAMAQMAIRSPSPSPSLSSSGEDEIVFKGRGATAQATASAQTKQSSPRKKTPEAAKPSAVTSSDEPVLRSTPSASAGETVSPPVVVSVASEVVTIEESTVQQTESDDESVVGDVFEKRLGGASPWTTHSTPWESRSKPGVGWLPVEQKSAATVFLGDGVDSKAAAMDDYLQNIRDDILGESDSAMPSTFARRHLDLQADDSEGWEVDPSDVGSDEDANDSQTGSDDESDASGDSEEDDDDDNDVEEYDDERLARVLQRQEELGLGSDEILLFGGDEIFDDVSDVPEQPARVDRPWKKRQQRSKGTPERVQPSFPSASALADALDMDPYNGFDVMDTERPSLRPRKKGRRGQPPPELSDSDLNEQLQATWAADRAKKRMKKAEREELRKQGLLGRKGKAPDLKVKYDSGIDMNDIVEEIREFMFSDMQTLSLPPMEAHRRAVVHQMVHQLGVNSKSRGDGANRFTVLSKTVRTKEVEHEFFDALLQKKKFRARFQQVTTRKGFSKATTRPGVSYKDGDKVGASAPELGPENKGRVLLEKMGWTKGTALGALDNKGILQPIAHTVKTGKAGLG